MESSHARNHDEDDSYTNSPPPTQFIIGGSSGAGVAGAGGGHTKIADESAHPLQKLAPDAWNNIPVCLVKAIKVLIEANISTDQRMRAISVQHEQTGRKTSSIIQKIEKDLIKKEELLKALIERSDKHLTATFNAKTHEIEQNLNQTRHQLGDMNTHFTKSIMDFHERLENFMDADQIREYVQWQFDQQTAPIRHEFKKDFLELKGEVAGMRNAFEIPGLIGVDMPYPNITDFLIQTYEYNRRRFDMASQRIQDMETKQIIGLLLLINIEVQLYDMKVDVDKTTKDLEKLENFVDDNFRKQRQRMDEDLKKVGQDRAGLEIQIKDMEKSLGFRLKMASDDAQTLMKDMKDKDVYIFLIYELIKCLRAQGT